MELNNYDIIVVGCGLSGVVISERFSLLQNKKILIIDKRDHIGGNCYDYYDEKTNILMNKYGAHLFHTNHEDVYSYINKYGKWSPWEHKVLGMIDDKHLPIPPNITTVNEIFNLEIRNKEEMDKWLSENQVKYENITNGEEMAKSRVGEVLYEKIFKHYTYKQWKKYPNELAPEVLARIPVRNSFDDRYFSDKYQVLPEKGYTAFFQSILDKHKHNIDVKLNCDFFDIKDKITKDHIVIYTGPIDAYFADKGLPKLEYRSIDFHIERQMNTEYYQPYSVVNYPSADTPYTRCVEYKHFLNQKSDHTVYVKETTTDIGEPYYPVLNDRNKELYKKYQKMAEEEGENIHFLGRLASYKYFNMDQAIKNSLDYYKEHFEKIVKIPIDEYIIHTEGEIIYFEKKDQPNFFAGCPNEDNIIYHYPGKYEWTKWKLNGNGDYDYIGKKFNKKDIELVIACNNGDIEWSRPYNSITTIYNKGDKQYSKSSIKLENVGREGHTFLHHIVENYDNLSNKTIFLSETISNESFKMKCISFCNSKITNIIDFINYSMENDEQYMYFPFLNLSTDNFQPISNFLNNDNYIKQFDKLNIKRPNISGNFIEWFTNCVCENIMHYKNNFIQTNHDIMTIEKCAILHKEKSYYEKILQTVKHASDPEEAHYLERSWIYIFSKYFKFSYGQSCMNRASFLAQTLASNLNEIMKYPSATLTLLNYNCQQNTDDVVKPHLDNSRLKYLKDNNVTSFHMSKTKNITALQSPDDTEVVSWADCDNFINVNTIYHNNTIFNIIKNPVIVPCTGKDGNWDAGSRIALHKKDFINLSGYNEDFIGWGYDDIDFKIRARLSMLQPFYQINEYLIGSHTIQHNDQLRNENYNLNYELLYNFTKKHNIDKQVLDEIIAKNGTCKRLVTADLNKHLSNIIIQSEYFNNNNNIKIYCDKRKMVWFKYAPKCKNIVENPNTHLIYNKNGRQKILSGIDYVGPGLIRPCSNLQKAQKLLACGNTPEEIIQNNREFYFYIRGHIRNSFKTDRLKNFINLLKAHFPNIKFILQTWKKQQCKRKNSWRDIKENNNIISKEQIENYFEDKDITKQCLIIDEENIELTGETSGNIGLGPCPKEGWKNMWYGIYKGLKFLNFDDSNKNIVSFRFDYFDIEQSKEINETKIVKFINENLNTNDIQFIEYGKFGTDNLYMGKIYKIRYLIERFHFNLDDILDKHNKIFNQEFLVNFVADYICGKKSSISSNTNNVKTSRYKPKKMNLRFSLPF